MSFWSTSGSFQDIDCSVNSDSKLFKSASDRSRLNFDASCKRDVPDGEISLRENFIDSPFCNKDNILHSVGYINQELEVLGIETVRFDGSINSLDSIFMINRIYDLLNLHRKANTNREKLENRIHQLSSENDHLHKKSLRVKSLKEQTEKDLDREQEKLRQVNVKYKQVCGKLKTEKDEVKKLMSAIQSRDVQFKHENKKYEKEIFKLKERLHQLLSDKTPDRKLGIDLMHSLTLNEGRRSTWKSTPGKQEEEMYQLIMAQYEERCGELRRENEELRDCLLSLQRELNTLLKQTGDMSVSQIMEISEAGNLSVSSENDLDVSIEKPARLSLSDLNEGYFQMPYDMMRQQIEKTFRDTCVQISDSMKKSLNRNMSKSNFVSSKKDDGWVGYKESSDPRCHSTPLDHDVDKLKKQVSKYKNIIRQQEELIQQSLTSHSQSVENTFLHESQLLKEKENLSAQKKMFFEEKANFEKERRSFTEAAIRLNKEKRSLQEEKAMFLKQHFLNSSPFKDNKLKKATGGTTTPRLLPATPVYSPAVSTPSNCASPALPSTAELYKLLALTPNSPALTEAEVHSEQVKSLEAPQTPKTHLQTSSSQFSVKSGNPLGKTKRSFSLDASRDSTTSLEIKSPSVDSRDRLRAMKASVFQNSFHLKNSNITEN